jgi:hypothetical protein
LSYNIKCSWIEQNFQNFTFILTLTLTLITISLHLLNAHNANESDADRYIICAERVQENLDAVMSTKRIPIAIAKKIYEEAELVKHTGIYIIANRQLTAVLSAEMIVFTPNGVTIVEELTRYLGPCLAMCDTLNGYYAEKTKQDQDIGTEVDVDDKGYEKMKTDKTEYQGRKAKDLWGLVKKKIRVNREVSKWNDKEMEKVQNAAHESYTNKFELGRRLSRAVKFLEESKALPISPTAKLMEALCPILQDYIDGINRGLFGTLESNSDITGMTKNQINQMKSKSVRLSSSVNDIDLPLSLRRQVDSIRYALHDYYLAIRFREIIDNDTIYDVVITQVLTRSISVSILRLCAALHVASRRARMEERWRAVTGISTILMSSLFTGINSHEMEVLRVGITEIQIGRQIEAALFALTPPPSVGWSLLENYEASLQFVNDSVLLESLKLARSSSYFSDSYYLNELSSAAYTILAMQEAIRHLPSVHDISVKKDRIQSIELAFADSHEAYSSIFHPALQSYLRIVHESLRRELDIHLLITQCMDVFSRNGEKRISLLKSQNRLDCTVQIDEMSLFITWLEEHELAYGHPILSSVLDTAKLLKYIYSKLHEDFHHDVEVAFELLHHLLSKNHVVSHDTNPFEIDQSSVDSAYLNMGQPGEQFYSVFEEVTESYLEAYTDSLHIDPNWDNGLSSKVIDLLHLLHQDSLGNNLGTMQSLPYLRIESLDEFLELERWGHFAKCVALFRDAWQGDVIARKIGQNDGMGKVSDYIDADKLDEIMQIIYGYQLCDIRPALDLHTTVQILLDLLDNETCSNHDKAFEMFEKLQEEVLNDGSQSITESENTRTPNVYAIEAIRMVSSVSATTHCRFLMTKLNNAIVQDRLPGYYMSLKAHGPYSRILSLILNELRQKYADKDEIANVLARGTIICEVRKCVERRAHDELNVLLNKIRDFDNSNDDNTNTHYDSVLTTDDQIEITNAVDILLILKAISMAKHALSIDGVVGNPNSINIKQIETHSLVATLETFAKINKAQLSASSMRYFYTCEYVLSLRRAVLKWDWRQAFELSRSIFDPLRRTLWPLSHEAVKEIEIISCFSEHAYINSKVHQAIVPTRSMGATGSWDMTRLSTCNLYNVLSFMNKLQSNVIQVRRLQFNAELVYNVRRAQLEARWLTVLEKDKSAITSGDGDLERTETIKDGDENNSDNDTSDNVVATTKTIKQDNTLNCYMDSEMATTMNNLTVANSDSDDDSVVDKAKAERKVQQALRKLVVRQLDPEMLTAAAIVNFGPSPDNYHKFDSIAHHIEMEERDATFGSYIGHTMSNDKDTSVEAIHEMLIGLNECQSSVSPHEKLMSWAIDEITEAGNEARYRWLQMQLIDAIQTPGPTGVPGALNMEGVEIEELSVVILKCYEYSDVADKGECKRLLRDCKHLLRARQARIMNNWIELNRALHAAEVDNSVSAVNKVVASMKENASGVKSKGFADDLVAIISPVWNELMTYKADAHFYVCLNQLNNLLIAPKSVENKSTKMERNNNNNSSSRSSADQDQFEMCYKSSTAVKPLVNTLIASNICNKSQPYINLLEVYICALVCSVDIATPSDLCPYPLHIIRRNLMIKYSSNDNHLLKLLLSNLPMDTSLGNNNDNDNDNASDNSGLYDHTIDGIDDSAKEKQNKSGITPLGLLRKALNDSYTKNGDEPMSHENIYMSHSTLKNAIKGMEELHKENEKSGKKEYTSIMKSQRDLLMIARLICDLRKAQLDGEWEKVDEIIDSGVLSRKVCI